MVVFRVVFIFDVLQWLTSIFSDLILAVYTNTEEKIWNAWQLFSVALLEALTEKCSDIHEVDSISCRTMPYLASFMECFILRMNKEKLILTGILWEMKLEKYK